ncbi:hypothetical protein P879_02965 [Paragonimus westermani]|uniref:Fibronectin type-III domain-containing protein n=1 Tax=Paragonimus westermani TaxID=34504 RepID=A0A8T0DBD1_9TREM|nr:hypothetical protein P879_02965 [Paragonimus westermani]
MYTTFVSDCSFYQTPVISGQCVLRAYGLIPDTNYVFAVAAYDEDGQPLGTHQYGLGHSTSPILACPPLSSLVALSYLAQTAYKRELPRIGSKCVQILWNKFVMETLPEQPYRGPDSSPIKGFKTYRLV